MTLGFKINHEDLPARFINDKITFLKWPMIFTLSTAFRKQLLLTFIWNDSKRSVPFNAAQMQWNMSESSYFNRFQHYKTKTHTFLTFQHLILRILSILCQEFWSEASHFTSSTKTPYWLQFALFHTASAIRHESQYPHISPLQEDFAR